MDQLDYLKITTDWLNIEVDSESASWRIQRLCEVHNELLEIVKELSKEIERLKK